VVCRVPMGRDGITESIDKHIWETQMWISLELKEILKIEPDARFLCT